MNLRRLPGDAVACAEIAVDLALLAIIYVAIFLAALVDAAGRWVGP